MVESAVACSRKATGKAVAVLLTQSLARDISLVNVGGRDLSVGVPKISLLMKYECYSYCATGCHGSFWSLLCC